LRLPHQLLRHFRGTGSTITTSTTKKYVPPVKSLFESKKNLLSPFFWNTLVSVCQWLLSSLFPLRLKVLTRAPRLTKKTNGRVPAHHQPVKRTPSCCRHPQPSGKEGRRAAGVKPHAPESAPMSAPPFPFMTAPQSFEDPRPGGGGGGGEGINKTPNPKIL